MLQKPASIEIHKAGTHDKFSNHKANTETVKVGASFDMQPEVKVDGNWIVAGTDQTEGVTYTQSGAG
ncbi:MAG: hypothetical protein HDR04_07645 [Lachnospiraceae bacterium]|nr:hypothetical protein [Lachnospiraceae bacterium]